MAVDSGDCRVGLWSPLRSDGDTVVPMPRAVDEKDTPLGSPQSVHKEDIAEGPTSFRIGFEYTLNTKQSQCFVG